MGSVRVWGRVRGRDAMHVAERGAAALLATAVSIAWGLPGLAHDVEEEPKAPLVWDLDLTAGGTLRGGDENNYAGNADLRARRLWSVDTLTFHALGYYGKTGGDVDTNNAGAFLDWHRQINHRFFWLTQTGAETDPVQARDLRLTASTGPGYRVWEQSDSEFFDAWSGLGYRYEKLRQQDDNNLFDARVGYRYRDKISKMVDVIHQSEAFAPVNDIQNFLFRSELTLGVPLIAGLQLRNNVRYEYVNDPAEDREHSNVWLTIGITYHFESRAE